MARHEFPNFPASHFDQMTLSEGHDTPPGHQQSLCDLYRFSDWPSLLWPLYVFWSAKVDALILSGPMSQDVWCKSIVEYCDVI